MRVQAVHTFFQGGSPPGTISWGLPACLLSRQLLLLPLHPNPLHGKGQWGASLTMISSMRTAAPGVRAGRPTRLSELMSLLLTGRLITCMLGQLVEWVQLRELLEPRFMPMVCKPLPWTSFDKGGYILWRAPILRHKQVAQLRAVSGHAGSPLSVQAPSV